MPSSAVPAQSPLPAPEGAGKSTPVGADAASALLRDRYGHDGDFRMLSGERDENYLVQGDGAPTLFKVFGQSPNGEEAELLVATLRHLEHHASQLPVPRIMASATGADHISFTDASGAARQAALYTFLPGTPLIDAVRSVEQQRQCGVLLADLAIALQSFAHPLARRRLVWDLARLPELRTVLPDIVDLPFAPFVSAFLDNAAAVLPAQFARVPQQFVHNDFNARNLIVDAEDERRVTGIIDFGDAVHTARIADVAIGVIGQIAAPETADQAMAEFVAAYQSVVRLTDAERALLPTLVAGRIVQNIVMTAWYRSHHPNDPHFAAFGPEFFAWRVDFAQRLLAAKD